MAKDQKDFFRAKRPWSEVKDELLRCYLKAYFQKVLTSRRPVRYFDCFAGRGEFEDGQMGSPLIALDVARECLGQGQTGNNDLRLTFIEAIHAADLMRIISDFEQERRSPMAHDVIEGRFEREVTQLVARTRDSNVFLYIDPFGIRDLDHTLLTSFADPALGLYSIELLINLNSFGFIRAGCRAMRVSFQDDDALRDEGDEFTDSIGDTVGANATPVDRLNAVAGGEYWQTAIKDFASHKIDGYTAERHFSDLYRAKLAEKYRYVLSMPIRLADHRQPKYRMVHATNHPGGCILMADNMTKRTENLYIHIPRRGQGSLFEEDLEGDIIDSVYVREIMLAFLAQQSSFADSEELIADFYVRHGVICHSSVIREALKCLEQAGTVEVRRTPTHTPTGKVSTFFTPSKGKQLSLRAK